ncbi:hypothetical protein Taro_042648 [Colocasia esculenta]|uniref:EF-hand domain-containing protein n=1 Tax=Colocasia esculenta TaxID=4460 RepID=A0A843WEG1_COLES|nr:hypothetical protein [Colocasia esculenta]
MASSTSSPAKRTSKRGSGRSASGGQDDEGTTEYEKQRLSRIRENQERLEALGLRTLASALLGSSASGKQGQVSKEEKAGTSRRQKKKGHGGNADDEDDEYRPSEEDQGDGNFSSGEEETEEEEASSPGARRLPRGKGQKKASSNAVKVGKKLPIQSNMDQLGDMDDDAALQQAIALSLEKPMKCSAAESNMVSQNSNDFVNTECHGKNNVNNIQQTPGRGKRRKPNVNRPQMSEDELVAYFFSIDESGKGSITLRDLMRMAVAHDFCWTDKEITDMIYLFDSNKDGQLGLDDFRKIASRCNMIQESGNG